MPSTARDTAPSPVRRTPDQLRQLLARYATYSRPELRCLLEWFSAQGFSRAECIASLPAHTVDAMCAVIGRRDFDLADSSDQGRFLRLLDLALSVERAEHLFGTPDAPQAIHGLPITSAAELEKLAGASFCISFQTPYQLEVAIRLLGPRSLLMIDNGAFTAWRQGVPMGPEWVDRFYCWATPILLRVEQAFLIIPDIIEGRELDNRRLVSEACAVVPQAEERACPVWHYTSSLRYLADLVEMGFAHIAFGACGPYRTVGSPEWRDRTHRAFAAITAVVGTGAYAHPRIHLMRGLNQLKVGEFPFATADSTNLARNHAEREARGESITAFRARIERDRFPTPATAMWPRRSTDPPVEVRPARQLPRQAVLFPGADAREPFTYEEEPACLSVSS